MKAFYVIEQRDRTDPGWSIAKLITKPGERMVAAYWDLECAKMVLHEWVSQKHIGTDFLIRMGQRYRIRKVTLPRWHSAGTKVKGKP